MRIFSQTKKQEMLSLRKTSPAIRLMALWKSAAYSLIVCCFFSKLQSDLLHSTASDTSDFLHTVVQKSCEAF